MPRSAGGGDPARVPAWGVALAVAIAVIVCLLLGAAMARGARGRRARARNRTALRGEAEAVRLLEDAGYAVEGRSVAGEGWYQYSLYQVSLHRKARSPCGPSVSREQ